MGHVTWIALVATALAVGCGGSSGKPPAVPVAMETARATALARVPGDVKEEELEEEGGRWVYEFDIAARVPAGRVQEVTVDAHTGQVVQVEDEDDDKDGDRNDDDDKGESKDDD